MKEQPADFTAVVDTREQMPFDLDPMQAEPGYLQEHVRAAIMANMDMEIYETNVDQEEADAGELAHFRSQIVEDLGLWVKKPV